jgi:hypothetical protein
MQKIFILISFTFLLSSLNAQVFQEISCGSGYNKQSYIKLSEGVQKQVNNDAWDLAFTAYGFQDAGIFINESSGSSMGQNLPQTELYDAKTTDFNASISIDAIKDNKYLNSEESWNFGAFNETRSVVNPFDFGWGKYNPAGQRVDGDKVFVLRLRNGEYKKIKIESLIGTTYTFRYANLDGSNEIVKTINKMADSKGQKIIYFSFTSNETVDVLPAGGFDMMYGRYTSLAKDPNGTIEQQYNVTGILTGPGVQVAAAKGINPVTVSLQEYSDKFSTRTDVIGHDWKSLVGTSWSIAADRAYFVKMADKRVWKIVFIDFEGSATGNAVFEKTDLGISSNNDITGTETGISPNPVNDELIISFDSKDATVKQLNIEIIDQSGKVILRDTTGSFNEFNVTTINTSNLNSGIYFVRLSNDQHESTTKKIIKI